MKLQVLPLPIASLFSGFFTLSYVGSLYLSKNARLAFSSKSVDLKDGQERIRESNERWRDDPDVIKARLTAASISTFTTCVVVIAIVWNLVEVGDHRNGNTLKAAIKLLGFDLSLGLSPLAHLVTPVLFIGPLYVEYLTETLPGQRNWSWNRSVRPLYATWPGIRNYLVAPITEELVFRASILSVMQLAGCSHKHMIFLSPLWFGVAHVHHCWDLYNRYGRTRNALMRACITCLVQLTYTSLFGWFTSFLFLRTGSILAPITSHVFCNLQGLPNPTAAVRMHPKHKISIWASFFLGILGFYLTIEPWTRPPAGNLYWQS